MHGTSSSVPDSKENDGETEVVQTRFLPTRSSWSESRVVVPKNHAGGTVDSVYLLLLDHKLTEILMEIVDPLVQMYKYPPPHHVLLLVQGSLKSEL